MGTSTLFKRFNDLHRNLADMPKEDLKKIDEMSPWKEGTKDYVGGWSILMELHNGNVNPLVWWYGRLFHLRDAPRLLMERHYNKYTGKYTRESGWALLHGYLERELKELDKEYKRMKARERRKNKISPQPQVKAD